MALSFNTQPPEGGWLQVRLGKARQRMFQHTAARRRLASGRRCMYRPPKFQHTAARRRLALPDGAFIAGVVFQHTAARRRLAVGLDVLADVPWFQHTAARRRLVKPMENGLEFVSFNTQPPEGGWLPFSSNTGAPSLFQHTAARRRLDSALRGKAGNQSFNTQPPEGGWAERHCYTLLLGRVSTHSRPKAAGFLSHFKRS